MQKISVFLKKFGKSRRFNIKFLKCGYMSHKIATKFENRGFGDSSNFSRFSRGNRPISSFLTRNQKPRKIGSVFVTLLIWVNVAMS